MLQLLQSKGGSRAEYERYFQHAITLVPGYMHAYVDKEMFLSPKWADSTSALLDFVRESARTAEEGSPVKLLPYFAHQDLCSQNGGKKAYYSCPGVWRDIESAFPSVIQHHPKSGLLPMWYAEAAAIIGRTDIADTYFKIAQEREPNNSEIIKARSKYESRKKWDMNLAVNSSVTEDLKQRMDEAYKLFECHDLKGSEQAFLLIVQSDPTKSFAWQMLGKINEKRSEFSRAVKYYDEALKYSPRSASTLTDRCYALMMLHKFEEGISDCTKAIALDPKAKYAYLNRGPAYQMSERNGEADKDFKVASRLP